MAKSNTEFNTTLYRILLTGKAGNELLVDVVGIPAQKKGTIFVTAHGKRINEESLLKATSASTSNEVVMCVYAPSESDVEAAVTSAWMAARKQSAQALADAQALFTVTHGKPTITHKAWSQE